MRLEEQQVEALGGPQKGSEVEVAQSTTRKCSPVVVSINLGSLKRV